MGIEECDKIIIGAGLYGMYSALFCCKRGEKVIILESDSAPFMRATFINQARVHQGYHYPRSLSTAMKTAMYFERFNNEFDFCINRDFKQIYATSGNYSWTNGRQFKEFCKAANIPCEELHPNAYFKSNVCDSAFLTCEYTYDAGRLKEYFLGEILNYSSLFKIVYNAKIAYINKYRNMFEIRTEDGNVYRSPFVLNATYAGINQIQRLAGFDEFKIKYELCEIILCDTNKKLHDVGFTIMDGPFFSIMPFGMTGYHSLTSVTFTPHITSHDSVPSFYCQNKSNGYCSQSCLGNCNYCIVKPKTNYPYMSSLAKKYLLDVYEFSYVKSLFSLKPILISSEIDDSRPTVIRIFSKNPTFVGVLSGKISTVYDLDEVLING